MSYTDEHLVEAYGALLERLHSDSKLALIERLTASMKTESNQKEDAFYAAFGGFASEESAETILTGIKAHRRFTAKDVQF